jgi:hypothetical protein
LSGKRDSASISIHRVDWLDTTSLHLQDSNT